MKATYKGQNNFRQQLYVPLTILGTCYKSLKSNKQALKIYTEAFQSLPNELHRLRDARGVLMQMAELNNLLGKRGAANDCVQRAVDLCRIAKGEQAANLFKQLYSVSFSTFRISE